MQVLEWLLPTTERLRKRACFTLANRINQLAIDVIEDLVEARYTCDKLEWLRVLLRRSYVSSKGQRWKPPPARWC